MKETVLTHPVIRAIAGVLDARLRGHGELQSGVSINISILL
jgi:hypothetical protein